MRRIGLLLTIILAVTVGMASPALAAPAEGSEGDRGVRAGGQPEQQNEQAGKTADTTSHGGAAAHDPVSRDDATADTHTATSNAQENSGEGMNRQGGPSTHPGNGWKDPGQDQGSPSNTADPDCTGNRTQSPQATNIGNCDDPAGAADKPGGSGGFDDDRDWNNGCGNDTDFEDDNNGLCLGPPAQPSSPPSNPPQDNPPQDNPPQSTSVVNPPPVSPPAIPPAVTPPVGPPPAAPPSQQPPVVLTAPPVAPPAAPTVPTLAPVPRRLAATGAATLDLTAAGLALVALGTLLVRRRPARRW